MFSNFLIIFPDKYIYIDKDVCVCVIYDIVACLLSNSPENRGLIPGQSYQILKK